VACLPACSITATTARTITRMPITHTGGRFHHGRWQCSMAGAISLSSRSVRRCRPPAAPQKDHCTRSSALRELGFSANSL
jgi:hypothetical protein